MSVPSFSASYTVSNLNDSGLGSFRQAIIDANGNPGEDVIDVTIAGTVMLSSNLTSITESLIINANGLDIDGQASFRGLDINGSMNVTINRLNLTMFKGGWPSIDYSHRYNYF